MMLGWPIVAGIAPAAAAECSFAPQGEGRVAEVIDARSFRLQDGREVRLAGIEPAATDAPPANRGAALAAILGRAVTLQGEDDIPDRYGRQPAFVFLDGADTPVQGLLLAQGDALAIRRGDGQGLCVGAAAAETAARQAKRGAWIDPAAIKNTESPGDILTRIGRFTVVEGKVLSVRQAGATTYLNFGRNWTRDFAVTIPKRGLAAFEAAGIVLKSLESRGFASAAGSRRMAGRGLRRSGWGKSKCWAGISSRDTYEWQQWHSVRDGSGRPLWAAPALLCVAVALAACGEMGHFQTASPPTATSPTKPTRAVVQTPAVEREHERILSSYGGAYDDPQLEALIGKTVDRLVAASDRPDQGYKVTILNSGAVNAFALPTGQLYVTRGLIALACDTSELSSVLSHEMAHVLAKHAAIREDQAKQAALVTRVITDMGNDPDLTAMALAKTKLTMASFSRQQEFEADKIGVGISARAHFDPYGASRFLTAMERNAELKVGKPRDRSAGTGLSVVAPGNAGADPERTGQRAAVFVTGKRRTRSRNLPRRHRQPRLWRGSERGICARPSLPAPQARLHLHRPGYFHA